MEVGGDGFVASGGDLHATDDELDLNLRGYISELGDDLPGKDDDSICLDVRMPEYCATWFRRGRARLEGWIVGTRKGQPVHGKHDDI